MGAVTNSTIETAFYSTVETFGVSLIRNSTNSTIEIATYSPIKWFAYDTIENSTYCTVETICQNIMRILSQSFMKRLLLGCFGQSCPSDSMRVKISPGVDFVNNMLWNIWEVIDQN